MKKKWMIGPDGNRIVDMREQVCGRLRCVAPLGRKKFGKSQQTVWKTVCEDCGLEAEHSLCNLHTGSAGCRRCGVVDAGLMHRTHGGSNSRSYKMWLYWRKRGLAVREWQRSFVAFCAATGTRPKNCTLFRPDRSKPLGPDNWKWVNRDERRAARSEVIASELACSMAAAGLIQTTEIDAKAKELSGVSRQRMSQIRHSLQAAISEQRRGGRLYLQEQLVSIAKERGMTHYAIAKAVGTQSVATRLEKRQSIGGLALNRLAAYLKVTLDKEPTP